MESLVSPFITLTTLMIRTKPYTHRCNHSDTGLVWAARLNQLKVVQHMVSKRVNLDVRSQNGNTAIKVAAEYGFIELVECLATGGAETNIPDNKGLSLSLSLLTQDISEGY